MELGGRYVRGGAGWEVCRGGAGWEVCKGGAGWEVCRGGGGELGLGEVCMGGISGASEWEPQMR